MFDASKYLVDIYLESSLEPFNNETLYNDFQNKLDIILQPWKTKIARLLVDEDKFVSTITIILNNISLTKCSY